jgi:[ribosomal protein S5]-alanine N-acetyltransferase
LLYPEIVTERLVLREPERGDLTAIFEGLSNERVLATYGEPYRTKKEAQVQMDWFEHVWQAGEGVYWAIAEAEKPGRLIGCIGYYNLMESNRKAELTGWLSPGVWGKGYMREAIDPTLKYGFTTFDLHRIECLIEAGNKHAQNLLTNTGFTHEGTLRECEVKGAGLISLEMWGLLEGEFNVKNVLG